LGAVGHRGETGVLGKAHQVGRDGQPHVMAPVLQLASDRYGRLDVATRAIAGHRDSHSDAALRLTGAIRTPPGRCRSLSLTAGAAVSEQATLSGGVICEKTVQQTAN